MVRVLSVLHCDRHACELVRVRILIHYSHA